LLDGFAVAGNGVAGMTRCGGQAVSERGRATKERNEVLKAFKKQQQVKALSLQEAAAGEGLEPSRSSSR
jgi:hypothetical protein